VRCFSTPEQSERWSDLMPLLSWQLWLAKENINDCPLPWQKPSHNLSPGRVANSFAAVLAQSEHLLPLPNPEESRLVGHPVDPDSNAFVIQLLKKALPDRREHPKSLLKAFPKRLNLSPLDVKLTTKLFCDRY